MVKEPEPDSGCVSIWYGKRREMLNYTDNFGYEWNKFSKTQLDSANGTDISHKRFYEVTKLIPQDLKDKRVLEIGCGMGRFLEIAAKEAKEVVGIDASSAVKAARDNLKHLSNVKIIQADLHSLPDIGKFDLIYSIGVLHHTPDPRKAFLSITPYLAKGGRIAIWVNPKSKFPYLPKATKLVRLFTPKLKHNTLLKAIKVLIPILLPIVRLPIIGRILKGWVIPICDYKGQLLLSRNQLKEWAILDTFDLLSPKYLFSHSAFEVAGWFDSAKLSHIDINTPWLTVRGKRRL